MIVFHGTNQPLTILNAESWVTTDYDAAQAFANEKAAEHGGEPNIIELDIDEDDVNWDLLSAACGVDDERGILTRDIHLISAPSP